GVARGLFSRTCGPGTRRRESGPRPCSLAMRRGETIARDANTEREGADERARVPGEAGGVDQPDLERAGGGQGRPAQGRPRKESPARPDEEDHLGPAGLAGLPPPEREVPGL